MPKNSSQGIISTPTKPEAQIKDGREAKNPPKEENVTQGKAKKPKFYLKCRCNSFRSRKKVDREFF